MRFADTIASIITISAVLLSAYAVGLLIRYVRTGTTLPQTRVVAEADGVAAQPKAAALAGHSTGQMANVSEQPAEANEPMKTAAGPDRSMQNDEKLSKSETRRRTDGRRGDKALRALSPREREQMRQRWESMSDEQRQKVKTRTQSRSGAARPPRRKDVSQETSDTEQETGETDSEPDRNNQD